MKRTLTLLALTFLTVTVSVLAQDTANLVGTVKDSTGAVIPAAKITVSNPEKGFMRSLVSNAAGEYSAPRVPIGDYVITAEVPGFQKLLRSGITLGVGETLRVDLTMVVGQVNQEVTVRGRRGKVETETAAISGVVSGTQIANLSLNGRNLVTLALLVPGAVADDGLDTPDVGVYGNNSISFNGRRMQYNNWEIDGGNNTDEGSAATFNTYPSLDTIAEFRDLHFQLRRGHGQALRRQHRGGDEIGDQGISRRCLRVRRNDVFDSPTHSLIAAPTGPAWPPRVTLTL